MPAKYKKAAARTNKAAGKSGRTFIRSARSYSNSKGVLGYRYKGHSRRMRKYHWRYHKRYHRSSAPTAALKRYDQVKLSFNLPLRYPTDTGTHITALNMGW